jgi:hypothetical protein
MIMRICAGAARDRSASLKVMGENTDTMPGLARTFILLAAMTALFLAPGS